MGHTYRGGDNGRKEIQISNSTGKPIGSTSENRSGHRQFVRKEGDRILRDFVEAYENLVDAEVLKRFRMGDSKSINNALNQIHWRSINPITASTEEVKNFSQHQPGTTSTSISYLEAVKNPRKQEGQREEEWTTVKTRLKPKNPSKAVQKEATTIFLANIPVNAQAKALWDFFKKCGKVNDIILPRKRDKNNRRYGFIKTDNELEAGILVNNAKEQGGWGRRITMILNTIKEKMEDTGKHKKCAEAEQNEKKEILLTEELKEKDKEFGTKMFEFIEAVVDEDIEEGLFQTMVGFSWKEESADSLQQQLDEANLDYVKVVGLTERKFLLRSENDTNWDTVDFKTLAEWFSVVRKFQSKDLVLPRTVWIECIGLPMTAWLEENLKAYTSKIGEWISWSYQIDESNTFVNPMICLATTNHEEIRKELKVLVKGQNYTVNFKEVKDINSFIYDRPKHGNNIADRNRFTDERSPASKILVKSISAKIHSESNTKPSKDKKAQSGSVASQVSQNSSLSSNNISETQETIVEDSLLSQPLGLERDVGKNDDKGTAERVNVVDTRTPQCSESDEKSEDMLANNLTTALVKYQGEESNNSWEYQEFRSSQSTLCNHIENLNMGKGRGRPRKKPRSLRNPFDMRLGKNKIFKGRGNSIREPKLKRSCTSLDVIQEDVSPTPLEEADLILESAQLMGLVFPLSKEESKREIVDRLKSGIRSCIRDYTMKNKVNVLCLQETKCANWDEMLKTSIWDSSSHEWLCQNSEGLSGGLALSWDNTIFKCTGFAQHKHWIWAQLKTISGGTLLNIINIYAPQKPKLKRLLWKQLMEIIECASNQPVCLAGDFNCIRDSEECANCIYRERDSKIFNEFINNCNLFDMKLQNGTYTWFGASNKKSRLDRILLDSNWLNIGTFILQAMNRKSSDHKGLLLSCSSSNWGPKPFKAFNWWLAEPLLKPILKDFWNQNQSRGDNIQVIMKKLKMVIKEWSVSCLGEVDKKIKNLETKIDAEEQKPSPDVLLTAFKKELDHLLESKSATLRQKSRIQWSVKGDKNTKFFHQAVQKRAFHNGIKRIQVEGSWVSDILEVKTTFYNHYKDFFREKNKCKIFSLGTLIESRLTAEESIWLERDISLIELEVALKQMANEKAPGPDGFNIGYLKCFWAHIKEKVLECFVDFTNGKPFPSGLNSTLKDISLHQLVHDSLRREFLDQEFWIRPLRHWEKEKVAQLQSIIKEVFLKNKRDQMLWSVTKKPFTVKDCYSLLGGTHQSGSSVFKLIWSLKIPTKVQMFLWMMLHNSLPTNSLLRYRTNLMGISQFCKWCSSTTETQDHILWECEPAIWAWEFIYSWWEIRVIKTNIWRSFSSTKSCSIRIAWGIVIAATLWTLWMTRNLNVFEGKKTAKKMLENLIILRSASWSEAINLINPGCLNLWIRNPMGLVLTCSKQAKLYLTTKSTTLQGFIDGSWSQSSSKKSMAGIGGYVLDLAGNTIFIFSGPIKADSAFKCEYEALTFLLGKLSTSPWANSKVKIYSDNQDLVDIVQRSKLDLNCPWPIDESFLTSAKKLNFEVIKVSRILNEEADSLASKGAKRSNFLFSWC
ncbi:hypothetical protein POM88_026436 [Heracleum sosnowskyi]|uniref:RRM domain-containing protein n=1 Tax=Heracleum sosnowskyi TaxID=360622 RepID=A0AAD8I845_9APIA|nr:hypothetical protein POM88_026436 [Heracleum sosnowskyi]